MRRDEIQQEILDLFAKNSGQYSPTHQEVQAINDGLRDILLQIVPDVYRVVFNNDQALKVCVNDLQARRQVQTSDEEFNRYRTFGSLPHYVHIKSVGKSIEPID